MALAAGTPLEPACQLLLVDVVVAQDPARAERAARAALALAEASGHRGHRCDARQALATVARHLGDAAAEERWLLEAVPLAEHQGAVDRVRLHLALGDLARRAGRPAEARARYEAALLGSSPWIEAGGAVRRGAREPGPARARGGRPRGLPRPPGGARRPAPRLAARRAAGGRAHRGLRRRPRRPGECEVRLVRLWTFSRDDRVLRQPDTLLLLDRCAAAGQQAGRPAVVAAAERLRAHLAPG
ncbi:MAG: hypothetical protein R3F59_05750 [Myxococcota bacterium]